MAFNGFLPSQLIANAFKFILNTVCSISLVIIDQRTLVIWIQFSCLYKHLRTFVSNACNQSVLTHRLSIYKYVFFQLNFFAHCTCKFHQKSLKVFSELILMQVNALFQLIMAMAIQTTLCSPKCSNLSEQSIPTSSYLGQLKNAKNK